ncbi:MAG: dicarboxylate/amino acid:cation symporter [Halieaceae bacterium]|nr:dicarboxylate/amino acid:cation symporter [Halieaceae bacterium]
MSLTNKILLAMIAGIFVGAGLNVFLPVLSESAVFLLNKYVVEGLFELVGQVFIASLKLLVVPLVLVSLICGSSSMGDSARMGPIAVKTLLLYLGTTAVAISMALFIAVLVSPGEAVSLDTNVMFEAKSPPPLIQVLIDIFPSNPFAAMAEGRMLQVIVFALLVGYSISHAGEAGVRIANFFRDMEEVVMRMVSVMMAFAPYGVFALLAKLFATMGIGTILDLAAYFFTVLGVLVLHGALTYGLMVKAFTGLSPVPMFQKMRRVWAFAFSTASSGATLPITLRTVEKGLGVKNSVAGFTVPLGATINMDGTAIMQGVATVFIAQAYGIDLTLSTFVTVILTATLASIGTAAVPGVGLITLALVLEQAGLPLEGIALIIGVDRLLDMVRTAVNVTGDAAVSLVVGRSEREQELETYLDPNAGRNDELSDTQSTGAKR